MKIIMIAHNQLELVKQGIDILKTFSGIKSADIIVVDNASEDGLDNWLYEQAQMDYLVCDKGVEGYAEILNVAMKEFCPQGEDILVLKPNYIIIADAVQKLLAMLHRETKIGAVMATMLRCGRTERCDTYLDAVHYAAEKSGKKQIDSYRLGLAEGAVLLNGEMIRELGMFDNRMVLPRSVILDYLLRGIERGYHCMECGSAFFYEVGSESDEYAQFGSDADRRVLKEKWNMNYFNDTPNLNLISEIKKHRDDKFCILEIGCDCGANLLEVKNRFPGANLYGVELNEHAVKIASNFAQVMVGDIEKKEIDFSDIKFDYIMFGDVLEHLRNPQMTIQYCRSLLKENGRIIACIPNLMHYSVLRELINGNFSYEDSGLLDRTHIHFFTYNEIVRLFQETGFTIEEIRPLELKESLEPKEAEFVRQLTEISEGARPFMFKAYQYIVTVKI